jgi:hypothetical protein
MTVKTRVRGFGLPRCHQGATVLTVPWCHSAPRCHSAESAMVPRCCHGATVLTVPRCHSAATAP